jgi:exodeoxyribonuclease-5
VEATVSLLDYPEEEPIDVTLLLNTLQADAPALSYNQQKQLFEHVEAEYAHIGNRKNRIEAVMNNPYYNALQVKFAHVVTCHKAQGGQWPTVIIEQSWLPDGTVDIEYLRWLYTAITRAQEKVYLVGFDDSFFAD